MIEAYKIGVSLGMSGNVAQIVEQLIKQFATLDRAIQRTQAEVNTLVSSMRAIAREGRAAADAWRDAAGAMERAARAGNRASTSASRTSAGSAAAGAAAGAGLGAAVTSAGIISTTAANRGARRDAPAPPMLPYYSNPKLLSAPIYQTPYTSNGRVYQGEVIPPSASGGGVGGPPANRGPNINGTAGAGYTTYGPYGPPFGGQGGPGGGGPGGGGPGGRGPGVPGGAIPPPGGAPNPYPSGSMFGGFGHAATAGLGAYGGWEFLKSSFEEAAKVRAIEAALMKQGFTDEETAKARALSFDLQREVGTPVGMNMHIIQKIMSVTQEKEAALNKDILKEYAEYTQTVALHPDGKGGDIGDLDAAIRGGEFRGIGKKDATGKEVPDIEKLKTYIHLMAAANSITSGDIGAKQTLQLLRSSGGAGAFISDDEMVRQIALQIALGSGAAGSALKGFEQQFTAGRMSEAAANLLIKWNIVHGGGDAKHNPFLKKSGMGQFLLMPGAMDSGAQEMATENPLLFITNVLLPKYKAEAHKIFGKEYDNGDEKTQIRMEGQVAQQVASRIPGATEQVEGIRNLFLSMRDLGAVVEAVKRDLLSPQTQHNPYLTTQKAESAYQGVKIGVGEATMQPTLDALSGLARGLNDLAIWGEHHSEAVKIGLEALAAGLLGLGAAGAIAILMTLGGATGALAAFGAGLLLLSKGLQAAEVGLRSLAPWMFATPDKDVFGNSKKGVPMSPLERGWANPDHTGTGTDYLQYLNPFRRSSAPTAPIPGASGSGDQTMNVHIGSVSPQAASSLTTGIAGNQSRVWNLPSSGVTHSDPRIDSANAMLGGFN